MTVDPKFPDALRDFYEEAAIQPAGKGIVNNTFSARIPIFMCAASQAIKDFVKERGKALKSLGSQSIVLSAEGLKQNEGNYNPFRLTLQDIHNEIAFKHKNTFASRSSHLTNSPEGSFYTEKKTPFLNLTTVDTVNTMIRKSQEVDVNSALALRTSPADIYWGFRNALESAFHNAVSQNKAGINSEDQLKLIKAAFPVGELVK